MFQTMADLTPLMIGVVGIGQIGVVAWGIRVMRDAARERSEQTNVMLEAFMGRNKETEAMIEAFMGRNKETEVMLESLRETSRGIRELLERKD